MKPDICTTPDHYWTGIEDDLEAERCLDFFGHVEGFRLMKRGRSYRCRRCRLRLGIPLDPDMPMLITA